MPPHTGNEHITIDASQLQHALIPLKPVAHKESTSGTQHSLILGHNVGFDRARVLNEYTLDDSRIRYMDTMSLHVAVSGLSSNQRAQWLKIDKELRRTADEHVTVAPDIDESDLEW
jgi:DNA polymerase gamma 1